MKKILTFVTILITVFSLKAQDSLQVNSEKNDDIDELHHFVFMVPQYILINGLRLDYEYRHNKRHGFVLSGTAYVGTHLFALTFREEEKIGGSVELLHKLYFFNKMPTFYEFSTQIYLAHGPYYRQTNISYKQFSWQNAEMDGLEVLRYQDGEQSVEIEKLGYSVLIGVQLVTSSRFTLDFYTGVAFRSSTITKTSESDNRDYGEYWTSPGYSGQLLLMGCKLGVAF